MQTCFIANRFLAAKFRAVLHYVWWVLVWANISGNHLLCAGGGHPAYITWKRLRNTSSSLPHLVGTSSCKMYESSAFLHYSCAFSRQAQFSNAVVSASTMQDAASGGRVISSILIQFVSQSGLLAHFICNLFVCEYTELQATPNVSRSAIPATAIDLEQRDDFESLSRSIFSPLRPQEIDNDRTCCGQCSYLVPVLWVCDFAATKLCLHFQLLLLTQEEVKQYVEYSTLTCHTAA